MTQRGYHTSGLLRGALPSLDLYKATAASELATVIFEIE